MERFWRLFFHREPDEHFTQPHPAVLYLYLRINHGVSHPDLYDPGLFQECEKLYPFLKKESLVLFVKTGAAGNRSSYYPQPAITPLHCFRARLLSAAIR